MRLARAGQMTRHGVTSMCQCVVAMCCLSVCLSPLYVVCTRRLLHHCLTLMSLHAVAASAAEWCHTGTLHSAHTIKKVMTRNASNKHKPMKRSLARCLCAQHQHRYKSLTHRRYRPPLKRFFQVSVCLPFAVMFLFRDTEHLNVTKLNNNNNKLITTDTNLLRYKYVHRMGPVYQYSKMGIFLIGQYLLQIWTGVLCLPFRPTSSAVHLWM